MAHSLRKQAFSLRSSAVIFIPLVFFLISSCGLPTSGDIADPPFNVNDEGFRVTFNVRNSHALAIYYIFIPSGSTVEQNFGNITTNGETALSSRGYQRNNDLEVYVWVPDRSVNDPVTVNLEYASLNAEARLSVNDLTGVMIQDKILLRNSKLTAPNVGFSSPMAAYKDTGTILSGPVDVALAAISYKLNPTTMQLTPSVPQFLGYMRGLQIN